MESLNDNKTRMMRVEMARFEATPSTETFDRKGWIIYGPNNDFPFYRIDLYETAPVHSAICKAKIQMVAGKGFESSAQVEIDRLNLDEVLPDVSFDKIVQGGYYLEVVYSLDGSTVAQVNHLPFENMRLSFAESEDFGRVINGAFYSSDWANTQKKYAKPRFIPIFNPARKADEPRQVLFRFGKLTKGRVYPVVEYESCITWIETEKQIGIFHMNNLLNNLMPAHIINWRNGEPEPDAKARLQREFSFQEGAKGSGGTLHTFSEPGVEPPKIESFPISDADKQYQFLVTEARTSIMIGHRVTTPLLFGVREGGGLGSNTDEMRTGLEIFMQNVIEPDQRDICVAIVEILQASGVDATVEIIPNSPIELTPATAPAVQAKLEKKKTPLDEFLELGTDAPEGFILVDEFPVDYDTDDEDQMKFDQVNMVSTGSAFPNAKSEQDTTIDGKLFITRYRYRGQLRDNTRQFCRTMLGADKLYRKEDIQRMENAAVNPGWGPKGANTYDIWFYKGGGECHHFWQKEVYVSAEGFKIDVNNPNAQRTAVKAAEAMGYKIRNESLVAKLPVDMPYNGFLPSNPRFN